SERVLEVHPEEVHARGLRNAAPMDRLAAVVEDRHLDPRVVGPEPGRPNDDVDFDRAAVGASDRPTVGRDGPAQELDAVPAPELPVAGADQEVAASFGCAEPTNRCPDDS